MGSSQSSPEKQRLNAQRHLLVVRDPTAWQRLSNQGIGPVYLTPSFAPALAPTFLAILEPFYTGEYRRALERCTQFTTQLAATPIGHMYDPTVRYYCILRLMIQLHMGYYCYPPDLPVPNPPHLEPVPGDNVVVSEEYVVHRLLSAMFDTLERSAAQLREHGWNTDQTNPIVKDNIAFFKRHMQRFAVSASAQHPLSELHVWFWTYLFQFITERQRYLGVFASLKDPKAVFIKQHGTQLIARLAAERRPEALLLVVSRWATQSMQPPETLIPTAQGLLDGAATKSQHLLLRLAALVNAMPLLQKGKLDPNLFIAEGRACLTLAEQAQLGAVAACITLVLPGQILSVLTSNAQRLASIGRCIDAAQEDKRRVDLLLAQDNESIQAQGGIAAMRIMRETFDHETYLWGGMPPRNGHRSAFITHLHNWCEDILSQDSPSFESLTVVACSAVAAHRLAVDTGRAPEWVLGQKMLWSAFRLLSWYCDTVYKDATPNRQIVHLLHDVIVVGMQDHHRIPVWKDGTGNEEFYNRYSSWVSRYALWAPTFERWSKPHNLGPNLMAVRRLLEMEVKRDFEREDYEEVVRKKAGIIECMMYDHGAILDYNLWTCSTYKSVLAVLDDDSGNFGLKFKEKAYAATFVRRVEGIWLAWPRKNGVRQLLDEPRSTDFLTCSFIELAGKPTWAKDSRLRFLMDKDHKQAEMNAQQLELSHGDFLARCAHAATEIFAADSIK